MNAREKARRLKTGGLRGFLDDGQTPLHDTVQLWRVWRGEFLPDAAIFAQPPELSTTELALTVRSDTLDNCWLRAVADVVRNHFKVTPVSGFRFMKYVPPKRDKSSFISTL